MEVKYHHQIYKNNICSFIMKFLNTQALKQQDFQSYIIKQESDSQIAFLKILLLFETFADTSKKNLINYIHEF